MLLIHGSVRGGSGLLAVIYLWEALGGVMGRAEQERSQGPAEATSCQPGKHMVGPFVELLVVFTLPGKPLNLC